MCLIGSADTAIIEAIESGRGRNGRQSSRLHINDDLLVRQKRRALRHRRSDEAEYREVNFQALAVKPNGSFDYLAARLRAMTALRRQTPSELPLREGREER
jgi:plasmid stability protein